MRYNRSMDLLAAAVVFAREGKINSAAKAFDEAVSDRSITSALSIIESNNSAAHSKLVRATRVRSDVLEDNGVAGDAPGEELRVAPDENDERIVQEADFPGEDDDEEDEDAEIESAFAGRASTRVQAMSKQAIKDIRTAMSEFGFKFTGRSRLAEETLPSMKFSKRSVSVTLQGVLEGNNMVTSLEVETKYGNFGPSENAASLAKQIEKAAKKATSPKDADDMMAAISGVNYLGKFCGKVKVAAANLQADADGDEDGDEDEEVFMESSRRAPVRSSSFARALKNMHAIGRR